jgi:hypothetical protein
MYGNYYDKIVKEEKIIVKNGISLKEILNYGNVDENFLLSTGQQRSHYVFKLIQEYYNSKYNKNYIIKYQIYKFDPILI